MESAVQEPADGTSRFDLDEDEVIVELQEDIFNVFGVHRPGSVWSETAQPVQEGQLRLIPKPGKGVGATDVPSC